MKSQNPKWYHWTALAGCTIGLCIMGVLNITGGAAQISRFHVIDDVVVRLLGVGLILFSVSLFFRRKWAFLGSISLLALSILEIVATCDFRASSPLFTIIMLATTLVFFGAPIALLAWLRVVFINRKTEPNIGQVSSEAAQSASPDEPSM